jgi:triosephosphate isomerase
MRKPFVAGNWKMYKTVEEARMLASELVPGLQAISQVDKALCPPFTWRNRPCNGRRAVPVCDHWAF